MTNEEHIMLEEKWIESLKECKKLKEDLENERNWIAEFREREINSLQENTKLKAEIERLKGELKSEREWCYNVRIELLDRNKEIELLKEEIESRKTAGIKNNSNSRNDIEQLQSTNAKLCEENAELKSTQDVLLQIAKCSEWTHCYMCENSMKNITIDGVNNGCDGGCYHPKEFSKDDLLNKINDEIRRKVVSE